MSTTVTPTIPVKLDDALFDALRGVVGSDLAFAAVDAAWIAICEHATIVTRCDPTLREVLELEVHRDDA